MDGGIIKSLKVFVCLAVAAGALVCARASFAKHNVNVLRFNPAPDGGKYVNVEESNTLKQWKFNVGISFDYAFEPLEFATVEGARRRGIIDDIFEANAFAAVAFTDWLTLGANFPLVIEQTFWDPLVPAEEVQQKINKGLLGDARVEMKFRILDIERFHFGISVVPFIYIPTGNTTCFVGTGTWSPGGMLVLDGNIKNRLFLSLNAGYRMYQYTPYLVNELNPNAFVDDSIILNLGAHVRLSSSWAILGEVISESVISGFWKNQPQNPAEFALGMRYTSHNPRGLTFTFTGGGGITNGVGTPNYRVLFAVNYRRPQKLPPPTPVEVVVEEKIAITERIHFEFDKANIRPVSYPILDDVILLLQKNQQINLVRIEGHTDWIGSDEYNLKLSQRRANAVRDYLSTYGISPDRLIAVGYGESRPIADNNTVEGRARNRRIEFMSIKTGEKGTYAPPPPRPRYAPPRPVSYVAPEPKPLTKYVPPTVEQAKPEVKYVPPTVQQAKPETKYVPPTVEQARPSTKYVPPTYVPPAVEQAKSEVKYVAPQPKPANKYAAAAPAKPVRPPQAIPIAKSGGVYEAPPPPKPAAPVPPPPAPPQPKPQPPPPAVSSPGEIRAYTQVKGIVYFAAGGSELTPEGKGKLKEIADFVSGESSVIGVRFQSFPGEGETGDSKLSWDRAGNAQNYFASLIKGAGRKLDISSYGFANQTYGSGKDAQKGKVVVWVLRKFEK